MVKKKLTQLLAVSAISFAGFSGQAFACSTAAWESGSGKAVSVAAGGIRYEGLCALDAKTGIVKQAVGGSGDTYVRFYVFAASGAGGTIFKSGTLKAELSGGTLKVGGKSTNLAPNKWHQVQLQIKPTTTKVWVDNSEKFTATTGLSKVSEVVFGGATGKVFIDAVAVSNGKAIGIDSVSLAKAGKAKTLIAGDADGNGVIGVTDALKILEEFRTGKASDGVPDTDLNGTIGVTDALQALEAFRK